jgi:hypothetical protein
MPDALPNMPGTPPKPEPTADPVLSTTKCDLCDKFADFGVMNPGARDQAVCKAHLPWIYNINALPENVVPLKSHGQIYAAALKEKELQGLGGRKYASGENSDKASTPSAKQSNGAKGTVPTGDTSGN